MNAHAYDVHRLAEEALEATLATAKPLAFALQPIRPLAAARGLPWSEALLRHDSVNTADFILAAERLRWVDRLDLRLAADALARVPKDTRISLNVSAQSISDPFFLPHYRDVLEASGFPLNQIVVEITETAEITNGVAAATFCRHLAAYGVAIALDDYEGGRFPVPMDALQIVKFAYRDDPLRLQNIAETASFLRNVGIATVAEHVEDHRALQQIAHLGIDYYQGHYDQGAATLWDTNR